MQLPSTFLQSGFSQMTNALGSVVEKYSLYSPEVDEHITLVPASMKQQYQSVWDYRKHVLG